MTKTNPPLSTGEKGEKCEECFGTGMEICNNPDHGFLDALSFREEGRLGCPVCGHDEFHRVRNSICEKCNGTGIDFVEASIDEVNKDQIKSIIKNHE